MADLYNSTNIEQHDHTAVKPGKGLKKKALEVVVDNTQKQGQKPFQKQHQPKKATFEVYIDTHSDEEAEEFSYDKENVAPSKALTCVSAANSNSNTPSQSDAKVERTPLADITSKSIEDNPEFDEVESCTQSGEADFQSDFLTYMLEKEQTLPIIAESLSKQDDVTVKERKTLIKWMSTVAHEYSLKMETFGLAVCLLDRVLGELRIYLDTAQLVGAVTLFISSKLEETFPLDSRDMRNITAKVYDLDEIYAMERLVIQVLGFQLNSPTGIWFLSRLCGILSATLRTRMLANYFFELLMIHRSYFNKRSSFLAAAAVHAARFFICGTDTNDEEVARLSMTKLEDLESACSVLVIEFQNHRLKSTSMFLKYSHEDYGKVALLDLPSPKN